MCSLATRTVEVHNPQKMDKQISFRSNAPVTYSTKDIRCTVNRNTMVMSSPNVTLLSYMKAFCLKMYTL